MTSQKRLAMLRDRDLAKSHSAKWDSNFSEMRYLWMKMRYPHVSDVGICSRISATAPIGMPIHSCWQPGGGGGALWRFRAQFFPCKIGFFGQKTTFSSDVEMARWHVEPDRPKIWLSHVPGVNTYDSNGVISRLDQTNCCGARANQKLDTWHTWQGGTDRPKISLCYVPGVNTCRMVSFPSQSAKLLLG